MAESPPGQGRSPIVDGEPVASQIDPVKSIEDKDSTPKETAKSDVIYDIGCRDTVARQVTQFRLPKNPFEGTSTDEAGSARQPLVLEVFIAANGSWAPPPPPPPSLPPPKKNAEPLEPRRTVVSIGPEDLKETKEIAPKSPVQATYEIDPVSEENHDQSKSPQRSRSTSRGPSVASKGEDTRTETSYIGSVVGEDHDKSEKTKPIDRFRPSQVTLRSIAIHSKSLLTLFRSFIGHYPSQSLTGDSILVWDPFTILGHYYKDFIAIRDGAGKTVDERILYADEIDNPVDLPKDRILIDEETKSHLGLLLKNFEQEYKNGYKEEQERYDAGFAPYEMLWFLFRPGAEMYARVGGKLAGFVCEWTVEMQQKDQLWWEIHCWNLTYDGHKIIRTSHKFKIYRYRGEREILSLAVFPSTYLDTVDGGKTRSKIHELGEKSYSIIRQSPAHMLYTGQCWDLERRRSRESVEKWARRRPDTEYTGEIVIDHRRKKVSRRGGRSRSVSPYIIDDPAAEDVGSDYERSDIEEEEPTFAPHVLDFKASRSTFRSINPADHSTLSKKHYFLFPRRLDGFALAQKQKMGFEVEYIQPIVWPLKESEIMNTLILDGSDKDVVRALTRRFSKEKKDTWSADYTDGKGEGQIFLLHGPPGTGKTYTVECVAKSTRRPLLRLTVADIGTSERVMEDILGEWFQRGTDWGAIILIDEADVFLEKRQVKDLQRNSLVSVFLSCMEYYTGMLFLTTNRIGQIDDAFLSRISVALTYQTLDTGKQRLIWDGFLKKLKEERKDIVLTDRARKFVEGLGQDPTTKDVPWNGREIRNALQTAIALAGYDAEKEAEESEVRPTKILVGPEHFQAVVDRRKEFIEYRKSIRNQDEDARAYQEGSRAPPPRKN